MQHDDLAHEAPTAPGNMGDDDAGHNNSGNRHFSDVLSVNSARRRLLSGGVALALGGLFAPTSRAGEAAAERAGPIDAAKNFAVPGIARPSFPAVAVTRADAITVPPGYTARVLVPWGEPITGAYPEFREGGLSTGAEQEQQIGMHHDGMHFFPLSFDDGRWQSGLLVLNHEYVDQNMLHAEGREVLVDGKRRVDDVRKEIAAHGISVVELSESNRRWQVVRGRFNRRITGATPMELTGPVRGSDLLKTKFSPDGTRTRGTFNNCANGSTPWGTYLTCEENWAGYFVNKDTTVPREQSRYGVSRTRSRYLWESVEERFDVSTLGAGATQDFRNESNGQGWVVEIDPADPLSVPKKRTALGRFAHEAATIPRPEVGKRIVVYMGDDSRNEYIYKFVSSSPYVPFALDRDALDRGVLYVARFNDDGSGNWLALDLADADFRAAAARANVMFANQADVLVNTRTAADVAGATKMDRPEWGAVDPVTGLVYFTLTNNSARTAAQVNASNPRGPNPFGHIIRWREDNNDHTALRFTWDLFLLSGTTTDSAIPQLANRKLDAGSIHASPDGLWFDAAGLLWIQSDMSGSQLATGPFGNNQMLVANPATGDIRRFLVGPVDAEITGITCTPDMTTLFINVQHPGEESPVTALTSNWPEGNGKRPRSATVVITKDDGGIVGT